MEYTRAPTPISDKALDDAADIAAKAFINTASYVEVYRGTAEEREYYLREMLKRNIALVGGKAPESIFCYYADESCQELVCTFMLVKNTIEFTLWDKICAGLLTLLFIHGYAAFMRLLQCADFFDEVKNQLMAGRPEYLELQRMVISPKYQGKGLGSKLLGEALKEVADKQGLPVVLGTQLDKNVTFYSRL